MSKRFAVIALLFGVLLATAGTRAKTYTFTISDKIVAGNTALKPGEYHVRLNGSEAVVTYQDGKQLDLTATVETAEHKFDGTSLRSVMSDDGTNRLLSVQLGGTTYKLVFQ